MAEHRPLGVQISRMLQQRGVDTVFGIPGVHNIELYRGIDDAGITHVLARHEQGAGFMADGYARATGRPGVAFVISGPGVTNIMTPMGQAWSDSVPLLVISSCLDEASAVQGQLHQMRDQRAAAATVCDWSHEARTAQAAFALIDRALAEFRTRRPRPKHVQVPIAALSAMAPPPPARPDPADARAQADVGPLLALLADARRPLFIFGGGAIGGDCAGVVARFGAASFSTYAGRGLVPDGAPLHFGPFLARPGSADMIATADLVVAVGTELAEVDLWRPDLGHRAPLVRIDTDPVVLADRHGATLRMPADAPALLGALLARAGPGQGGGGWTADEVAAARARWRAEIAAERPGIAPVVDALRAALPPDTMIFSDMTQLAYAAKELWDMPAPGQWHHPSGFGTLGYALPAAIGGKLGAGQRPVVAIAGDYGLQYTLPELATAVELGLPLPVILWDNDGLGEIAASMVSAQMTPRQVRPHNPQFPALARAYGARAAEPATRADLARAVDTALAAPVPTLICLHPGFPAG